MDNENVFDDFKEKIEVEYRSRRQKSEKLFQKAQTSLPGGDTRNTTFHRPFPTYIERGQGCRINDVDGNSYIDFMNNFTALIHGHAHPRLVKVVAEQIKQGTVYGSPVESQVSLANEICDRIPSVDKVRFCNSGTEATMGAIRLARVYRKKYKVLKMEGGYHGSHDLVEISITPAIDKAGPIEKPVSVPQNLGIPPNVVNDCVVAPYNRIDIAEQLIERNHNDLAAIIIEAVQGTPGMVTAEHQYMKALRELASSYGIPFILDEVITFRLSRGGCQELFDISPDLTTLGKIIGGGFPIGAIGGKEEFMSLYSPLRSDFISHSGTFNGNPISMVAGLTALEQLSVSEIDRINNLGEQLRQSFRAVFADIGIHGQITGMGSLSQIHFSAEEVNNWRGYIKENRDISNTLHLMLLNRGIWVATRNMFCISTPMGEEEIETASDALKDCLTKMKPAIEKAEPGLVAR